MAHAPLTLPVKETAKRQLARLQSRRAISAQERKENLAAHLFLLPWFAGLIILTAGPMLTSLYLSFTRFDLLSPASWIGLENYINLFKDARWLTSVRVTLVYVFFSVPLKMFFALLLALLLKRGLLALGIYRAIYYVPSLLGGSVGVAILWIQLFSADGMVNQLLSVFGITGLGSWLASTQLALHTLVIQAVWQFGSPMIIFLAGLKQIPNEYYEAASTDGAGKLRTFIQITLPLISPIIFFNMILQMVNSFQAFTPAFIISGGLGGPVDSTLFYTLYLYQEGFGNLHMGYASAMAWVLLVVIAIFTGISFLTSRYWVFYQDEGAKS